MILQPPNDIDPFLDPVFLAKKVDYWIWIYSLLLVVLLFLVIFFIWKFFKKWRSKKDFTKSSVLVGVAQKNPDFFEKKVFEKVSNNFENYLKGIDKTKLQEFEIWLRFLWFAHVGSQVFSWTQEEWVKQVHKHAYFTKVKDIEVLGEFLQRSQAYFYQESKGLETFFFKEEEVLLFRKLEKNLKVSGDSK